MQSTMSVSVFSPEFNLMLSCCRVKPGNKELEQRDEALGRSIDEDVFFSLLTRHRVLPLVYWNLKEESLLSDGLKDKLKQLAAANQLQALQSRHVQFRLQKELDRHAYKGFFLKGVTLSEQYYGDTGLRHVMDIDCWVEQKAVEPIAHWLFEEGYCSVPDISRLNPRQLAFVQKTDHDFQFLTEKPGMPKVIELHWKLRGPLGGFTLRPEAPMNEVDYFLYLCTHGTEHGWFRLKWLFDLPQIINAVPFDWDAVRQRAITLDCLDHLEITMMVLQEYLKEPIPQAISSRLQPHQYDRHLMYIRQAISAESTFNDNDANRLGYLQYMMLLSRRRFNWALVLKYLTSHQDWKLLPLPQQLFFLYFPLRPFLVLWRRIFRRQ
jgi:hypothetical protein